MKLNHRWLIISLFSLSIVMVNIVYAQWTALNSGYAVTTDNHENDVIVGTLVTMIAGTTDESVEKVTFLWKYPNGTVAHTETVSVWFDGSKWDGKLIYYAQSRYRPKVLGDWNVQALFIGEEGQKAQVDYTIHVHPGIDVHPGITKKYFAFPDFPVVGTVGALTAMILGLSLYAYKRKTVSYPRQ